MKLPGGIPYGKIFLERLLSPLVHVDGIHWGHSAYQDFVGMKLDSIYPCLAYFWHPLFWTLGVINSGQLKLVRDNLGQLREFGKLW